MPAPRRRLALLAAPAAVLLLAGAACSDDDSSDDPTVTDGGSADGTTTTTKATTDEGDEGQGNDVCSVISAADLEEIVGSPYDAGTATFQAETGSDQCTYTNADAPPVKEVVVVRYSSAGLAGSPTGATADTAAEYYELTTAPLVADESLDIGDEAIRVGATVYVLDGQLMFTVTSPTGTTDVSAAAIVSVAEKVVEG
jgi:hypothetical protein